MQFRLAAADREKFGLPEWIAFDREKLDDTPYSVLRAWEQEIGPDASILQIVHTEWQAKTTYGIKGYMWLALKLAGDAPAWADFDIRTAGIKTLVGGNAAGDDPLAQDSSAEPSGTVESTPA